MNPTALILTDKKTDRIVHIIVCKDEDSISRYIMKDDPKLNYQTVPNWDIVCKAVENSKNLKTPNSL
jgi:hypothetical protein